MDTTSKTPKIVPITNKEIRDRMIAIEAAAVAVFEDCGRLVDDIENSREDAESRVRRIDEAASFIDKAGDLLHRATPKANERSKS